MTRSKKLGKAIFECMTRLYSDSKPSADFNQLLENAEINELGQKVINYDDYEIDSKKFEQIVSDVISDFKIKSKYDISILKFNVYLGASPKTKNYDVSNT
jgi:hypothetical protein